MGFTSVQRWSTRAILEVGGEPCMVGIAHPGTIFVKYMKNLGNTVSIS